MFFCVFGLVGLFTSLVLELLGGCGLEFLLGLCCAASLIFVVGCNVVSLNAGVVGLFVCWLVICLTVLF